LIGFLAESFDRGEDIGLELAGRSVDAALVLLSG
jgi:hypothetical protein